MRAVLIVVADSFSDQMASMAEVAKDVLIETLVAEAAVERLAERVLRGLARRNVMPFKASILRPAEDGVAGQLRAVTHREEMLA